MILFILFIALVIGLIAAYSAGQKVEKELYEKHATDVSKSLDEKFASLQESYYSLVSLHVKNHQRTLLTKRRQLITFDDYGNKDRSSWTRELTYFIDKVVDSPDTLSNFRHYYKLNPNDNLPYLTISHKIDDMLDLADVNISEDTYSADMSGIEFEQLVAQRLETAGALVRFTAATGDHGADLVVRFNNETIVVQCKRSATTIGNKAVQEAYAGCGFHEGHRAWVVSDAPFSRQAKELASSLAVRLVDFQHIEAALTN